MYGDPPTCRKCGLPIQFITTKRGKKMPVDGFSVQVVKRDKGGLFITEDGEMIRGMVVDTAGPESVKAWVPHFGSCPESEERKNRQAAKNWREEQDRAVQERIEKMNAEREEKLRRQAEKQRKEAEAREAADAQYSLFGG